MADLWQHQPHNWSAIGRNMDERGKEQPATAAHLQTAGGSKHEALLFSQQKQQNCPGTGWGSDMQQNKPIVFTLIMSPWLQHGFFFFPGPAGTRTPLTSCWGDKQWSEAPNWKRVLVGSYRTIKKQDMIPRCLIWFNCFLITTRKQRNGEWGKSPGMKSFLWCFSVFFFDYKPGKPTHMKAFSKKDSARLLKFWLNLNIY